MREMPHRSRPWSVVLKSLAAPPGLRMVPSVETLGYGKAPGERCAWIFVEQLEDPVNDH
jgi:hypothetical protein